MPEIRFINSLYTDANLEGYWRLESDGTDETSNNNDLTGTGTPSYTSGRFGNGVDLEGDTPQYLSIADGSQTGLDLSGDLTISAWVKQESYGTLRPIVSKYDTNSQRSYRFGVDANGALRIDMSDDGSSTATGHYVRYDSPNRVVPLGLWVHVAVTYDISTETCKIYLNGTPLTVTQGAGTTIGASLHNGTAPFAIGQDFSSGSSGNDFDGILDDVAIWSRILTDAEVLSIYESHIKEMSGVSNVAIELDDTRIRSDANLVAYWKLESDGTDETTNNNDLNDGSTNPSFTTGKFGNGADFESGSSQYLQILDSDHTGLDFSGDMSFSLWIKRESSGAEHNMIAKYNTADNNRHYRFYISSTDTLRFAVSDDGTTSDGHFLQYETTAVIPTGVWMHLAVTFDISEEAIVLYINGNAVTASKINGTTIGASLANSGGRFNLGAIQNVPSSFFDGFMDDVALFNRVLTANEVSYLYNGWVKKVAGVSNADIGAVAKVAN